MVTSICELAKYEKSRVNIHISEMTHTHIKKNLQVFFFGSILTKILSLQDKPLYKQNRKIKPK